MKIVESIQNTYKINNETLWKYIEDCDKNNTEPAFDDFLDWWGSYFFPSDFLEDDYSEFESVNGSFQIKKEFEKEVKRLRTEKIKERKNDGKV